MWSSDLYKYFSALTCPELPRAYACMNPYKEPTTLDVVNRFLNKYYNDNDKRTILFGINPGRFGSGITGISFTDPIRLADVLHLDHDFNRRPELSSEFIYEVIEAYGVEAFFSQFFLSAMYPLGFLQNGKNINYYEFKNWKDVMMKHIVAELDAHLDWNINREVCICIGKGQNWKILKELNDEHHWFKEIEVVPHPRWVMQYRRKRKAEFGDEYLRVLTQVS